MNRLTQVLFLAGLLAAALLLTLIPAHLTKAQSICLDSQGHFSYSSSPETQRLGVVPILGALPDTLRWSPLQLIGSIFQVGNNLNPTNLEVKGDIKANRVEATEVIRLVPTDLDETRAENQKEGMMYYSQRDGKFRCYTKDQFNTLKWRDCSGGGSPLPNLSGTPNRLTKWQTNSTLGSSRIEETPTSVKIYDSTSKKLRLEVTDKDVIFYTPAGQPGMTMGFR